jgi:hypothetical protein
MGFQSSHPSNEVLLVAMIDALLTQVDEQMVATAAYAAAEQLEACRTCSSTGNEKIS